MKPEYKFVPLAQLKMKDAFPGEISGHRSVFNSLDEGGDIVLPGAFRDSIEEYLNSGFTAHSHVWSFKDAVGFPISAKEDSHGFFVVSQFHSTADAQDIRTKAKERLAAGKTVGFSFGYSVDDSETISASEFDRKLPLYIKGDRLAQTLVKAKRFSQIRLLKKVSIIEDSLVTAPMNKLAMATGAKAHTSRRSSGRFSLSELSMLRRQSSRIKCALLLAQYGETQVDRDIEWLRARRLIREHRALLSEKGF